jgi:hypothetical protein
MSTVDWSLFNPVWPERIGTLSLTLGAFGCPAELLTNLLIRTLFLAIRLLQP